MDAFLPQGVANTFWGWATLSAWPSPELADAYRRRLADETLAERFSRIDLVQIYQATLAFDASSSHGEMISANCNATRESVGADESGKGHHLQAAQGRQRDAHEDGRAARD